MINIGNRIREIRTSKKVTVSKLAQKIGVAQSFVSGIEAGTKKCSLENLDKICHALGITLHDFFAPPEKTELSPDLRQIFDAASQPPEVLRIMEKIRRLTPDNLKVLESVLDTWVNPKSEKNEREQLRSDKQSLTQKSNGYRYKQEDKLYIVAETSEGIDVRSTPMAAHLENAESIPLTPELEEIIKNGIRESRERKREREAKQKKDGNNKAHY